MSSCPICAKICGENDTCIGCDKCHAWAHIKCAKISTALYNEISKDKNDSFQWFCASCKRTPRNEAPSESQLVDIIERVIAKSFEKYMPSIDAMVSAKIKVVVDDFSNQISCQGDKIDGIAAQNNLAMESAAASSSAKEKELKSEINRLSNTINNMERSFRLCDIVVSGVPVVDSTRDLQHFVKKLINVLHVNVDQNAESAVSAVFRRRQSPKYDVPPQIVVRLCSKRVRDEIFDRYFAKTNLCLLDIYPELGINSRIFLNEHLSSSDSHIVRSCAILRKQGKIAKYSTRNGIVRILVGGDGAKWQSILSLDALAKIFPGLSRDQNNVSANTVVGDNIGAALSKDNAKSTNYGGGTSSKSSSATKTRSASKNAITASATTPVDGASGPFLVSAPSRR